MLRIIGFSALLLILCISIGEAAFSVYLNYFGLNFCVEFTKYNLIVVLTALGCTYGCLAIAGMIGMGFKLRNFNYIYGIVFSLLISGLMVITILFVMRLEDIANIISKCSEDKLSLQELKDNKFINYVQREGKCCGIKGINDWKANEFPPSCCADEQQNCQHPVTKPCSDFMKEIFDKFGNLIIGGLCIMLFLSPVAIITIVKSVAV
ncbi:hypothetical protein RF11_10354 [Thelohanellus kitauei]|uniref:Tetraspanin n=1 Tax=Thelohanellus kitauei TaxID=669202 RepID=A0A0C2MHM2_THEKT|nr:hypothetical protein RF11_10354 [Thelohanellus kitauei]